jgi:hypothetical protein
VKEVNARRRERNPEAFDRRKHRRLWQIVATEEIEDEIIFIGEGFYAP